MAVDNAQNSNLGGEISSGEALIAAGRLKDASRFFHKLAINHPKNVDILNKLSLVQTKQKKFQVALTNIERSFQLNPCHADTLVLYGDLNFELGRFTLAAEKLQAALDTSQSTEQRNHCNKRLEILDRKFAAIDQLNVPSDLPYPALGVALYNQAVDLVLSDDIDTAILAFDLAAECRTNYQAPDLRLGDTTESHNSRMPQDAYQSCKWLEGGLNFHEHRLTFCCIGHQNDKGWTPIGQFNGGKLPIDYILAKRLQILRHLKNGTDNNCTGCPVLETRQPKEPAAQDNGYLFDNLVINNYSVCNFRCTYCSLTHANFEMPAYYYPLETSAEDILGHNWMDPAGLITWGGGDPSVSKEFRSLLTKFSKLGVHHKINTNAAIHVAEIDEALASNKAFVRVSVDAGTPSTFYNIKFGQDKAINSPVKIKGKDVYQSVWQNIKKYTSVNASEVIIKYIVDTPNANEIDVEGFIVSCKENGVQRIMFTPEAEFIYQIPVTKDVLPKNIYNAMCYGTARALAEGIQCEFEDNIYNKKVFAPASVSEPAVDTEAEPVS
jgi:tetratricopeptide (TPR) repeat protein